MKKFLMALLLVLCMAFPAAAATKTVTTSTDLKNAVASADSGDIIEVTASIDLGSGSVQTPSDRTLTLKIDAGCELSGQQNCIVSSSNLTIEGDGKIIMSGSKSTMAAVSATDCSVTIGGNLTISADNTVSGTAYGVWAQTGSSVTIKDSVNIYAHSNGGTSLSRAVCASNTGTVDIFGGTVSSGVLYSGVNGTINVYNNNGTFNGDFAGPGTINVYNGTFTAVNTEYYLGPDSSCTKSGDQYVVTNNATITFNPTSLSVAQGSSGVVSVNLYASGDVTNPLTLDKLEVTPVSAADGIIVTPSSSDHTITFAVANTCKAGTYTFNVSCTAPSDTTKPHWQTKTFTVTVKEAEPTPEPGKSDVSNGGCNAGFGALALAALAAAFAAKQRKK